MKILVTGAAGFVGANVARDLIEQGHDVVGCDSMSGYYSPNMKIERIRAVINDLCEVIPMDVDDYVGFQGFVWAHEPDVIIHLAAQPGVRYSLVNPQAYLRDNIQATWNAMYVAALGGIPIVYASSSSVYGNKTGPLREDEPTDPISLYASTKLTAEIFARQLQHTHGLRSLGLRFFTVYGPWGRPDMAVLRWVNACMRNESIHVTARPEQTRDATYIDDVVRAVRDAIYCVPLHDTDVVNVGGGNPHTLRDIITTITDHIPYRGEITYGTRENGDVGHTWASTGKQTRYGLTPPETALGEGIHNTVEWAQRHRIILNHWIESSHHPTV